MPRLPGPEQLGAMPSLRSGRATPSVGSLDTGASAIARGVGNVGAALTGMAERQSEKEDYEALKRMVEFERETEQSYELYKRDIKERGEGFQQEWDGRYQAAAKNFFGANGANFPARMRDKVDLQLTRIGEKYSTHAQKYELAELDRFHVADINDQVAAFAREVEAQPHLLREKQEIAGALIDRAPIEGRLKPQARKQAIALLEKTARNALVMGANTAADFKAAEDSLFVSAPMKPERPQKGDAGKLFKGPETSTPPASGTKDSGGIRALGAPPEIRVIEDIAPTGIGPRSGKIEGVVIHHTAGSTLRGALEHGAKSGTGTNYYIDRDGSVHRWVDEGQRTSHIQAPGSKHRAKGVSDNISNDNSIGIEVVARNDKDVTPEQRETLQRLLGDIVTRNKIDPKNVIGHGEIQGSHPFANREASEGAAAAKAFREASMGGTPVGVGGPKDGAVPPDVVAAPRLGPPSTDPSVRWASEERGEATYTGPFQNSTLGDRIATYRQLEARRKQLAGAVEKEIQSYEAGAAKGELPPEPYLADLTEKVERIGDPQVKAYFDSVFGKGDPEKRIPPGFGRLTADFVKARPEQLEAIVRNERAQNRDADGTVRLTSVASKRIAHVEKLISNMREQINADPISWAEKTGVAAMLGVNAGEIDPSDPASLQRRAEAARKIGAYYGQEPQFFTKGERDKLSDIMRKGGDPMLHVLGTMVQGFGIDARGALKEFAADAPEAAYLGTMMLDSQINGGANMKAIKDVAQAIELRRDKNYNNNKPATAGADHREAVNGFLGTVFRELPLNQSAFVATVDAAYETRARRKGDVARFDPDLWRATAKEVLGESTKDNKVYGGIAYQNSFNWFDLGQNNPVVVPSNVRKDGFRDLINTIRPEDVFSRAGYGGVESSVVGPMANDGRKPLPMADLRRANLVTVGPGQYRLSLGDPDGADPQWVKDANGDDYVLDLKALEPVLKRRRADLYLGYVEPVARPQLPVDQSDPVVTPSLMRTQRRAPAPGATTLAPPTAQPTE